MTSNRATSLPLSLFTPQIRNTKYTMQNKKYKKRDTKIQKKNTKMQKFGAVRKRPFPQTPQIDHLGFVVVEKQIAVGFFELLLFATKEVGLLPRTHHSFTVSPDQPTIYKHCTNQQMYRREQKL